MRAENILHNVSAIYRICSFTKNYILALTERNHRKAHTLKVLYHQIKNGETPKEWEEKIKTAITKHSVRFNNFIMFITFPFF